MLNSATIIFAVPKVLFAKEKKNAVWNNSDRGITEQQKNYINIQTLSGISEITQENKMQLKENNIKVVNESLLKSRTLKIGEIILTIILWAMFIYFLIPLINFVIWILSAKYLYINIFLEQHYIHIANTLTYGIIIIIIIFEIIASWFLYNYKRFYNKNRRKNQVKDLSPEKIAHYFSVPEKTILRLKSMKIIICQGKYYSTPLNDYFGSVHLKGSRRCNRNSV